MALLSGELAYRLLCRGWPPRSQKEPAECVYQGRSKLEICLGSQVWDEIKDKVVIDFGCGYGDQCIEMVKKGARRVIGIDIRDKVLEVAQDHALAAGVSDRCHFCKQTDELGDVILSLDSFEHFDRPSEILQIMASLLKPDGKVLVSFGPPWFHPLGGHLFSVFPWAHLIFSEESLIRWRAQFRHDGATRFSEIDGGLNQMSIHRFCALVESSRFQFESFEAVPIRKTRWFANPLTREFLSAIVRCRLVLRSLTFPLNPPAVGSLTSRMPRPLVSVLKSGLLATAGQAAGPRYRGIATCLMYHSIVPVPIDRTLFNPNQGLMVPVQLFEQQIRYLSQHYECLSLDEAIAALARGQLKKNSVCVTFDDGYRDNLTLGLPILERYRVPATIFISTGCADGGTEMWWEELGFILGNLESLSFEWQGKSVRWSIRTLAEKHAAFACLNRRLACLSGEEQHTLLEVLRLSCPRRFNPERLMLNWQEIETLALNKFITLGSHARQHIMLSRLNQQELTAELVESKKVLEQHIKSPVRYICYPFGARGQADAREFDIARQVGYVAGFTTREGHWFPEHKNRLFALPRIAIGCNDSILGFRWKLSGLEAMRHHFFEPVVSE